MRVVHALIFRIDFWGFSCSQLCYRFASRLSKRRDGIKLLPVCSCTAWPNCRQWCCTMRQSHIQTCFLIVISSFQMAFSRAPISFSNSIEAAFRFSCPPENAGQDIQHDPNFTLKEKKTPTSQSIVLFRENFLLQLLVFYGEVLALVSLKWVRNLDRLDKKKSLKSL